MSSSTLLHSTRQELETLGRKVVTDAREEVAKYKGSHLERSEGAGFVIGKALLNEVSGGNGAAVANGLNVAFASDHRTLQQSAFRALVKFITLYAEDEASDARNEGSKALAKELAEVIKEKAYLPLI